MATRLITRQQQASAQEAARRILEEAEREAEARRREAALEAKEEAHRLRSELDREIHERQGEILKIERGLMQREESLARRAEQLDAREMALVAREDDVKAREMAVAALQAKQLAELERVARMTADEARHELLARLENELQHEIARRVREAEAEAREQAERRAREIITTAVQRYAAEQVSEITVTVVHLPSDDMKGRIIGREGRNIRTLENLTGVDIIIDDTPEAVILSGFDPVRREIARMALERLIQDGRIHPARIEEMVAKAHRDMENRIREEAEQACYQVGVHSLHPELMKLLGRLRFRTSYGQNVLSHSVEVAHLAGAMAAELGLDVAVAKRAGLLHDIGKAVTHEVEGPHIEVGVAFLRKYKESQAVIDAVEAHHGDVEPKSFEAVLVTAADACSAARPGARRESVEVYLRRLRKLEEIAYSFEGVEKAYAIQAGREVRVMVRPDRVDDVTAFRLARQISKRIENEVEYPGQIKVTVIRELKAVEYAR